MPNMMKAKQKPLAISTLSELGLNLKLHLQVLQVLPPVERQAGIKVANVEKLVGKLSEQGIIL